MKEKIKIGIIGGSSGEILAITAKNMGLYSVLIAGNDSEKGIEVSDEPYIIDLKEEGKIVDLLMEKVDCVVIGTGHKYAHNIAKDLYEKGMPISIEPYKAEYGKNKILGYKKINELGYNTPNNRIISAGTVIDEKLLSSIKIPCVVKSASDEVKTSKATNISQLETLLIKNMKKNSDVIVDDFLDGLNITIPVVSNGDTIYALKDALDMTEVNKMAIDGCGNFEESDTYYDKYRNDMLTLEVKNKIVTMTEDIVSKIGLIGVPRFDIILTRDGKMYILEINEVAVSHFEDTNFPYAQVRINMAEEMIKVTLNILRKSKEK